MAKKVEKAVDAKEVDLKQEGATASFSDNNGNTISFKMKLDEKTGLLNMENDFGDKKPEEHTGFYAHLAHGFFSNLVGEENLPEAKTAKDVN